MKPHRLLPWQRTAIAAAYAAGEKVEALCAEFGVTRRTVPLTALRLGVPPRPNGRPKRAQVGNRVLASVNSAS